MRRLHALLLLPLLLIPTVATADEPPPPLTPDAVNLAELTALPAARPSDPSVPATPDPAIVILDILLDRAGASPGVSDGFDGDNLRKAIRAFETMVGLEPDGQIG